MWLRQQGRGWEHCCGCLGAEAHEEHEGAAEADGAVVLLKQVAAPVPLVLLKQAAVLVPLVLMARWRWCC